MNHTTVRRGFTLIELLVVIAIVSILVVVVFLALDPAQRIRQARDAVHKNDVQKILSAVKLNQADNGGSYLASIDALTTGNIYLIVDGAMSVGCDDNNESCDTAVSNDTACVNLAGLVGKYLENVPISPAGAVTWDQGSANGEEGTGYTLERDVEGVIHVRSCENEDTAETKAAR